MHCPDATARSSVFYRYRIHPFSRPPEMADGTDPPASRPPYPAVIVGAGPIGMATALDLARFGVASVLLEAELQVSHGSRAIVLTRRSLEILQQIGVVQPFLDKGLPWSHGRSFYREQEIYRMVMPHDQDSRFLPGLNLQQQYIEQYLVDACNACPLIEIRWGSKLTGLSQTQEAVTLHVDTPEGPYDLTALWVVAADGGRSTVRQALDLRMSGRSYPGQFVIADILAKIDLPTERLCFFDPPWNPGNTVLVHRQPDDLWRLDFRLPEGESPEQALAIDRLSSRIQAILAMIGQDVAWQLDWATIYSANSLTLSEYRANRVLFVGDAAHLLPIFGVRGANTGFQDSNCLAWKLAFAIENLAPDRLLDSYSQERVTAALEICDEAGKSTRFMTPPSRGYRLLRDAVLSWSLSEEFAKDLLHWRTSRPHIYATSPLNSFVEADAAFVGGVALGEAAYNVRLGTEEYLFDRLAASAGFHLFLFTGPNGPTQEQQESAKTLKTSPIPVVTLVIGQNPQGGDIAIADPENRIAAKYCASPGSAFLFRPDFHLAARWQRPCAQDVLHALHIATAQRQG